MRHYLVPPNPLPLASEPPQITVQAWLPGELGQAWVFEPEPAEH
jgi:hypothetical protein